MSFYIEKGGSRVQERPCTSNDADGEKFTYGRESPVDPAFYNPGEKKRPSGHFYNIDFSSEQMQNTRMSRQVQPMNFGNETPEHGIYWWSPTSMLLTYLMGVLSAIGQHIFYSSLAGDYVGDVDEQQRVLRYAIIFQHDFGFAPIKY